MKIDLRKPDLRIVSVGTIVITSKGFEFELIDRDTDDKETWKDLTSGLKWFDKEDKNYTHDQAMELFKSPEKRLPTIEEFEEAEEHGFREVLPNIDYWFWSASLNPNDSEVARDFNGVNGSTYYYSRSLFSAVRCVGRGLSNGYR